MHCTGCWYFYVKLLDTESKALFNYKSILISLSGLIIDHPRNQCIAQENKMQSAEVVADDLDKTPSFNHGFKIIILSIIV